MSGFQEERNSMNEKEGKSTGMTMILLQIIFCGLEILSCEDAGRQKAMMVISLVIVFMMCICVIYTNMKGLYHKKMHLHNGVLCLLLAISIGVVEGIAKENFLPYIIAGIFGGVCGVCIACNILRKQGSKKPVRQIGHIALVGVPVLGIFGGRRFLMTIGEENAVGVIYYITIILEIIFTILAVISLMQGEDKRIHSNRD